MTTPDVPSSPRRIEEAELPHNVSLLLRFVDFTPFDRWACKIAFLFRYANRIGFSILHVVVSLFLIMKIGKMLGVLILVCECVGYAFFRSKLGVQSRITHARKRELTSKQMRQLGYIVDFLTFFGYPMQSYRVLEYEMIRLRSALPDLRGDVRRRYFRDLKFVLDKWNVYAQERVDQAQWNLAVPYPKRMAKNWVFIEGLFREVIKKTDIHLTAHPAHVRCETKTDELKWLEAQLALVHMEFDCLLEDLRADHRNDETA